MHCPFLFVSQCDKAMACLLTLETLIGQGDARARQGTKGAIVAAKYHDIAQSVLYAKFAVLVQDGDWQGSEQCVRTIITSGSYLQCLEVVTTFLAGISGSKCHMSARDSRSKGVEMYRALMAKFPGEDEVTNSRICLVEFILSTAQLHDTTGDHQLPRRDWTGQWFPLPQTSTPLSPYSTQP